MIIRAKGHRSASEVSFESAQGEIYPPLSTNKLWLQSQGQELPNHNLPKISPGVAVGLSVCG